MLQCVINPSALQLLTEEDTMRRIIGLLLVLCMGACLVACGSSNKEASDDADYKQQKVTYKGNFEVTCINDEIVCDKASSLKPDNIVITLEVKNIGKKDEKFSSYANVFAKQGKDILYSAYLKDKKDKTYSFYRDQIIKSGDTATLKYDYKLNNHKDDVVLEFSGYTQGSEAGKMKFKTEGRQTKQNANYEESSKREYESREKIKEGKFKSCTVTVPKGWVARSLSTVAISMEKEKDGPSQIISVQAYDTKIASAKAEAKRYLANFGNKKLKIKKYAIDGKTCYGFEPTDNQFYIYAKSSKGGRVEIDGMGISYKEAKKVIDKNIDIK